MSRILLGVCGGIAAYKAAALTSFLVQRGDEVDVVMTEEAQRFVGPLTFSALTCRPVYTSLWDAPETIPHIRLVRDADVMVIAPATANVISKMAAGTADDLLTCAALAARIPVIIAPAMNDAMYEHAATQAALRELRGCGHEIVEPGVGFLAEREVGIGRLSEREEIVAAIDAALRRTRDLVDERIVINAGPTREAIDPVRFISNAATGATGIELAREALARGARVDLVLGPTSLPPPHGANVARVVSAQEMCEATLDAAADADVIIATAAVADWRPVRTFERKVKKSEVEPTIGLERTPDILAMLGERKQGRFLVGFAAETHEMERSAREKLAAKNLDAIVANDVSRRGGVFGLVENELTILWGAASHALVGPAGKRELARKTWDVLIEIRRSRVSS